MNPPQKINEREIAQYNIRLFHHNTDKLEDFSMQKIFRFIERNKYNRFIENEYGD